MIVVIQNWVPHYRKAFFNALCDIDAVTVIHSGKPSRGVGDRYEERILSSHRLGPLVLQNGLARAICELAPHCVVASADIRNIASVAAMFRFDRSLRWIWWGMDRGASSVAYRIKRLLARRDNAIVFYNEKIRSEFGRGAHQKRFFVANNTFHVESHESLANCLPKDIFLNVGTLDARKQNDVLIRAFAKLLDATQADLKLYIVGEGSEMQSLLALANNLGLKDRIVLTGKIEDTKVLRGYYARAIASVSFGQAGLAVLQSMAFGVPFITKIGAISGGEKNNIVHGVNGFFCEDNVEALRDLLLELVRNPALATKLGSNAYRHYVESASISNMVSGFRSAMGYRRSR